MLAWNVPGYPVSASARWHCVIFVCAKGNGVVITTGSCDIKDTLLYIDITDIISGIYLRDFDCLSRQWRTTERGLPCKNVGTKDL